MNLDKLIQHYEKMLLNVSDFLISAETTAENNIENALQNAKESFQDLKELSEEEIEYIQKYLIRDLKHISKNAKQSNEELTRWFKFDVALLESRIWDAVIKVADPTWLKLAKFKEDSFHYEYKTGQLTGPASLQCINCGKEHHFYRVSHIPPCSQCKQTHFKRIE